MGLIIMAIGALLNLGSAISIAYYLDDGGNAGLIISTVLLVIGMYVFGLGMVLWAG